VGTAARVASETPCNLRHPMRAVIRAPSNRRASWRGSQPRKGGRKGTFREPTARAQGRQHHARGVRQAEREVLNDEVLESDYPVSRRGRTIALPGKQAIQSQRGRKRKGKWRHEWQGSRVVVNHLKPRRAAEEFRAGERSLAPAAFDLAMPSGGITALSREGAAAAAPPLGRLPIRAVGVPTTLVLAGSAATGAGTAAGVGPAGDAQAEQLAVSVWADALTGREAGEQGREGCQPDVGGPGQLRKRNHRLILMAEGEGVNSLGEWIDCPDRKSVRKEGHADTAERKRRPHPCWRACGAGYAPTGSRQRDPSCLGSLTQGLTGKASIRSPG
jgi:hypothetical protein